jgi:hypothetical protein
MPRSSMTWIVVFVILAGSFHYGVGSNDDDYCPLGNCKHLLAKLRSKTTFGEMCQERGFTVAAELGVQTGRFSDSFLYNAPSTEKYILVDTWEQRSNYTDSANVDNSAQEKIYQDTMARLAPYHSRTKLVVMRNFTTTAVLSIPDASIDFIYVDARHDYCGVREDIELWWPKLKVRGIMAGDDYLTSKEHQALKIEQRSPSRNDVNDNWGICGDGTLQPGAVKGAVKQFAFAHGLTVYNTWKPNTTRREKAEWPQWILSPKKKI